MTAITIIAGGSTGLGAALVDKFNQNQHQVHEFSRSGSGPGHIDCDFSHVDQSQQLFQRFFSGLTDFDEINLVINTATLAPFGGIGDADLDVIEQHLAINVQTTTLLIQSFLATFSQIEALKTITYISSGAARRPIPGLALYSASKAFFERLIDTISAEQQEQPHPFKCLVINPGVMDTGMQQEIRSQDEADFPLVGMWQEWHEAGQLAQPEDIARVCYELITEKADHGDYCVAQDWLKK